MKSETKSAILPALPVAIGLIFVPLLIGSIYALLAWLFMLTWGAIIPDILHLPTLSYWNALKLAWFFWL